MGSQGSVCRLMLIRCINRRLWCYMHYGMYPLKSKRENCVIESAGEQTTFLNFRVMVLTLVIIITGVRKISP